MLVTLKEEPEQPTAVVRGHVTVAELPDFLGGAYDEVMHVLMSQGLAPCGPPFGRYTRAGDGFDVEAGFPCLRPVTAAGRVEPGSLPAGPAAVVLHRGPYDRVGAAYEAAGRWLRDHGYAPVGASWESYLDGPEVAEPRTVVTVPCRPVEQSDQLDPPPQNHGPARRRGTPARGPAGRRP